MSVRNLTAFLTPTLLLMGLACLAPPAFAAPQPKVEICHIPPGNPDNFHTLMHRRFMRSHRRVHE